jgi:hypothetical protein
VARAWAAALADGAQPRLGAGEQAVCAPLYDRLGYIVDSLLRAACVFLVARRLAREF